MGLGGRTTRESKGDRAAAQTAVSPSVAGRGLEPADAPGRPQLAPPTGRQRLEEQFLKGRTQEDGKPGAAGERAATGARDGRAWTTRERLVARFRGGAEPLAATGDRMAGEQAAGGASDLLGDELRSEMESLLGADLAGVRLHTDGPAQRAADGLEARAFTHGRHIYFGAGQFQPGSREGRRLLAHELAHVAQGGAAIARKPKPDAKPAPKDAKVGQAPDEGQHAEREADAVAERAVDKPAHKPDPDEVSLANAKEQLKSSDAATRMKAVRQIADLPRNYRDALLPVLSDPNPWVRLIAASVLLENDKSDPRPAAPLIAFVKGKDKALRGRAMQFLAMAHDNVDAAKALAAVMLDGKEEAAFRKLAAISLLQVGTGVGLAAFRHVMHDKKEDMELRVWSIVGSPGTELEFAL